MNAFCYKEADTYRKTIAHKLEHMEFVLASSADLNTLPNTTISAEVAGEVVGPCAPGSIAVVPSEGAVYMLDPADVWGAL